ncbi:hypothetical protein 65p398 [Aeromonas phage 65]|uniref:Uncharacterized protein n=2 Tax=Ishigurovirus osborne TaxID=260149 RepID=A0A219YCU5_9CAUD|nr:head protein [Aeromonas phage 65]ADQ53405.1 hypothetical protein 65p398 [Aeromonas phage 65]APU01762.1 hypothetical protein [Aeromonas phage 65.2]
MKIIVTRDQFIKAHLNFVNSESIEKRSNEIRGVTQARHLLEAMNNLFVFDIKHIELDYEQFATIVKYWPKKKN